MILIKRLLALKEERFFPTSTRMGYVDPFMVREHARQYPVSNKYLRTLVSLSEYEIQQILSTFDAHPSFTLSGDKTYTADQYIRYILTFAKTAGISDRNLTGFLTNLITMLDTDTANFFKYSFSDNTEKKALISKGLQAQHIFGVRAEQFISQVISACLKRSIPPSTLLSESQIGDRNASVWQFLINCQKKGASYAQSLELLLAIITAASSKNINSYLGKMITALEAPEQTWAEIVAQSEEIIAAEEVSLMSFITDYAADKETQIKLMTTLAETFELDLYETGVKRKAIVKDFLVHLETKLEPLPKSVELKVEPEIKKEKKIPQERSLELLEKLQELPKKELLQLKQTLHETLKTSEKTAPQAQPVVLLTDKPFTGPIEESLAKPEAELYPATLLETATSVAQYRAQVLQDQLAKLIQQEQKHTLLQVLRHFWRILEQPRETFSPLITGKIFSLIGSQFNLNFKLLNLLGTQINSWSELLITVFQAKAIIAQEEENHTN